MKEFIVNQKMKEIARGVYQSADVKRFSFNSESNITYCCETLKKLLDQLMSEKVRSSRPNSAMRCMLSELTTSKDTDELYRRLEASWDILTSNSREQVSIRVLISLWRAGVIAFPQGIAFQQETILDQICKTLLVKPYIEYIKTSNKRIKDVIEMLHSDQTIDDITVDRIMSRFSKCVLLLCPIGEIEEIPQNFIDWCTSQMPDQRGRNFVARGLNLFNGHDILRNATVSKSQVHKQERRKGTDFKWVLEQHPDLIEWQTVLSNWIKALRNYKSLSSHVTALNHLLLYLIENPAAERSPLGFVRGKSIWSQGVAAYVNGIDASDQARGAYLGTIRNFFEWFLDTACSEPSPEDGIPIRLPGFENPVDPSDILSTTSKLGQTHRLAMPWRYVELCKEIITKNDFEWPRSIQADYIVIRHETQRSSRREWSPVRAYAMLLRLILPLRTYQVRMLDSGEGDGELFCAKTGQWHPNSLDTKKWEVPQGVLRKVWDQEKGSYFTGIYINTNKTKIRQNVNTDDGYVIPWENSEVIDLMVQLRDWQSNYNKLSQPVPYSIVALVDNALSTEDVIARTPDRYYMFRDATSKYNHLPISNQRLRSFFILLMERLQTELQKRGIRNADGSEIVIVTSYIRNQPSASIFDPHSLRVTGITALAKAGVPIEILSKIVAGHTSILMTLWYSKYEISYISDVLSKAEDTKRDQADEELARLVHKISNDQLHRKVASNSSAGVASLRENQSAIWTWMDWGICPVASSRCGDGGEAIVDQSDRQLFGPVRGGNRNCPLCRFFVTGPQYLLGLVAKFNETSAAASEVGKIMRQLQMERQCLMAEKLVFEQKGASSFGKERELQKVSATLESAVEDFNILCETAHALYNLRDQCRFLLKQDAERNGEITTLPFIVSSQIEFSTDEVPEWEAADEICKTASFFKSINWRQASLRRSNAFNRMLMRNDMEPVFVGLSEEDAKRVGDVATALLIARLGRERTRAVFDGGERLAQSGLQDDLLKAMEEGLGRPLTVRPRPLMVTPPRQMSLENDETDF